MGWGRMDVGMTQSRTKTLHELRDAATKRPLAYFYGHGISEEMLDAQRELNGIHDDRLHAAALAFYVYKRPPWYKRLWRKVKGWWK